MESNDELRDFDIKNLASYYFKDFGFNNFLLDKNHTKIFWFMIFRAKLWLVQSLCVIGLIKLIDLLEFMMEIDI